MRQSANYRFHGLEQGTHGFKMQKNRSDRCRLLIKNSKCRLYVGRLLIKNRRIPIELDTHNYIDGPSAHYVDKVLIKNCKMHKNRKGDVLEEADVALAESVRGLGALVKKIQRMKGERRRMLWLPDLCVCVRGSWPRVELLFALLVC